MRQDEYTNPNVEVFLRQATLMESITSAFTQVSAPLLRRWYVTTFVLDSANSEVLLSLSDPPTVLVNYFHHQSWPTTEHAAIGHRLLWALYPTAIAEEPEIYDPTKWNNETSLAMTLLHVFRPWESVRYDPEGENWYSLVGQGQWRRFGKGSPSDQMVDGHLSRWFKRLGGSWTDYLEPWPSDPNQYESPEAGIQASMRNMTKFTRDVAKIAKIRQVLETMEIMHLDTSTLNQVRAITPFANGALCLITESYRDTAGHVHTNRTGQLLPFHPDYMVTNANSLPWLDVEHTIPDAYQIAVDNDDWFDLDAYEFDLWADYAPTYQSFLLHAFPDIEERQAFLRLLGAAMYGSNLKIVAAMIGEPNAGKDTVINWLSYLMPGQVASLPFSAFTPHGDDDRGFAPLMGARVATVSGEIGEGRGSKLLAEKIKTVSSGGGTLRVAEKYEKPTTIFFDGMLFLQGNSVPTIQGGDKALYQNRIVAVEFKHAFPLTVNRKYDELYRSEAAFFAQILFIYYLRYQQRGGGMAGVNPPESWRAFAKEFADNSNPHGFLESCIQPSQTPIKTSTFHAALSAMASKYGSPYPVGPNYWPKRIRTIGYPLKGEHSLRKQISAGANKGEWVYYLGIDAALSDGMFTQMDWERTLKDASVI